MTEKSEVDDFLRRPLADIIDEVERLRAENAALTQSNNARRRKISAQTHLFGLYTSQLAEAKISLRMAIRSTSLPQEILLTIFKFTQPPSYLYEPSLRRGPRNPWLDALRTKKALVLVCKAWAAPATQILYSDIVLRRMGQISALAHTFRTDNKQSLTKLVRSIRVDLCVVLTHCADVVREDFEYILSQCTMLLSFAFNPYPCCKFSFLYGPVAGEVPTEPTAFNPTWILDLDYGGRAGSLLAQSLNSRLLTLHLGLTTYEGSFRPLARLLSSAPYLTSLTLGHFPSETYSPPSSPEFSPLPDLVFPALETLAIHCDFPPFLHFVITQWTMPRLAYLTCVNAEPIPTTPLLEAHGTQLTYLHFTYCAEALCDSDSTGLPEPEDINILSLLPRLHELCPRISHLVGPIGPQLELELELEEERTATALNIHSPTLRYLDITGLAPSVAAYRAIALTPTAHRDAPQLRKVRMVASDAAAADDSESLLPLPSLLHPSHMPGSPDRALEDVSAIPGAHESDERADWLTATAGGIEAVFLGRRMRQHAWAIVRDELELCGDGDPGRRLPRARGAASDSGDPRSLSTDDGEADSSEGEGEYEYESPLASSPSESDADDRDSDQPWEGELHADDAYDDACVRMHREDAHSDSDVDGSDSDSDMERESLPCSPPHRAFVDDPLDSSRGQYDRETILARFSESQLGDFLLD